VSASSRQDVTSDGKVVIPRERRSADGERRAGFGTPCPHRRSFICGCGGDRGRKSYTIATSSAGRTLGGKGKRDAGSSWRRSGGAIIGALAGGGKAAAIGAAVSGSGTAGAAATGKKDIEFPAETKLAFTTRAAVAIN